MGTNLDELSSRLDFVATAMRSGLSASLDGLLDLTDRIEAVDKRLTAFLSSVMTEEDVAEKIAANYVRFMETLVGPDLPEGVSPSAAVPNASHALTHREVVAWNAHQEKVTEGTLFFIQSEENRTPVYVVLPDGKEVLEYFDHARLTE